MMRIPWRDILKFLSGAFFVTAGASWYFSWLNMAVPFFGAAMSPEFLYYRGFVHFAMFLASFYYGFLKQSSTPSRYRPLVIGILLFALLMGLRGEFASVWVRAAVAGAAGSVLAYGIVLSRRAPDADR